MLDFSRLKIKRQHTLGGATAVAPRPRVQRSHTRLAHMDPLPVACMRCRGQGYQQWAPRLVAEAPGVACARRSWLLGAGSMRAWDLWDAPLGRSTDDAYQHLHLPVRTGAQRWRGAMTFPGAGSTTGLSLTVTLRRHWTLCDANRSTFVSFEKPTPAERLSSSYHSVGGCGSAIVGGGAGAGSRSDCGEGAGVPIVRSCGCVKPWCGECPSPVLSQHQPQQHQPQQQQQQQQQQQHSGHTEESSSRIQSCRQQAGTWERPSLCMMTILCSMQCCDRLRGPLWLDDVLRCAWQ